MAVRVSFRVSCWALPCSMACRRWRRSFFFIKALIFVMRILSLPMGNVPTARVGDLSKSCETPPNVEVFFQQSRISTSLSWNFRRQISRNRGRSRSIRPGGIDCSRGSVPRESLRFLRRSPKSGSPVQPSVMPPNCTRSGGSCSVRSRKSSNVAVTPRKFGSVSSVRGM